MRRHRGRSGSGRAIAARFQTEGAEVVITDIDEPTGRAAAAEIGCQFELLDVRDEGAWSRWQAFFRWRTWSSTMPG